MLFKIQARTIVYMGPANERRRYTVTPSLIGWAHTQNDPCSRFINLYPVKLKIAIEIYIQYATRKYHIRSSI